ncbi:MAG TPA: 5-formyltetrahydrofolate cyclo-ligase [Clostridia bacterium]|jgi:5-formyltetrahydrofolate cyclo-ligase|nr:5-formyltetrahydrofolate cyclo-ligase [Clostridia bacterium]
MIDKQQLRVIAKSKVITNKSCNDKIIANKVISFDKYRAASTVFIYLSRQDEVSTDLIIKKSFLECKRVFVPVIKSGQMLAVEIYPETEMTVGTFNIREPQSYISNLKTPIIDIAIIPIVACDVELNRLGHGGGYYDKWLAQNNVFKLGLCYDTRKFDIIPTLNHDIKMDAIITERTTYLKISEI